MRTLSHFALAIVLATSSIGDPNAKAASGDFRLESQPEELSSLCPSTSAHVRGPYLAGLATTIVQQCAAQVSAAGAMCNELCGTAGIESFDGGFCGVGASCVCARLVEEPSL